MNQRLDDLKTAWEQRSDDLGLSKRAVLFKRLPSWVNELIHRRHVKFTRDNIPENPANVLDVGCGYGRISMEIKQQHPNCSFYGVDLCSRFSDAYGENIGPCFQGPIQQFESNEQYDAILIVTTLMYLNPEEQTTVLQKLWSMLRVGGCIVCIEPASEIFLLWRYLTRKPSASPTGGTVCHFSASELVGKFSKYDSAKVCQTESINLIPFLKMTSLHHAVSIYRTR